AEVHLPADRGDAHAVAVIPDPAHHARDQVAVARFVERAEAEAVEQGHRAGAHREDVAQDAAHAGRGALVGLHRRRVVVRLDLERDGPPVGEPQDARVLAGALNHLGAGGGKRLEDRLRVLIGAVLAPQGGEDAQLGDGGRAPEQRFDPGVFGCGQVVLADELGRDRWIAGEGGRPGHASGTFAPVTPRITVRKTRLMMPDSCCSRFSTSPLSNHTPWQCVHWSTSMPCHSPVIRSYPHFGHFMWCERRSASVWVFLTASRCWRSSSASRRAKYSSSFLLGFSAMAQGVAGGRTVSVSPPGV